MTQSFFSIGFVSKNTHIYSLSKLFFLFCFDKSNTYLDLIEQKGMTFYNDCGYSHPLFSSLLKKRGKKKINRKNRDQKSCLFCSIFGFRNR